MLWYEETYNFRVLTSATTSVVEISGFVVVVVVVDSDLIINVIE